MSFLKAVKENISRNVNVETTATTLDTSFGFISMGGKGASTIIASLADLLAKEHHRVLVIDLNFMYPSLAYLYGMRIKKENSIANYFLNMDKIEDYTLEVKDKKNIWIISSSPDDDFMITSSCSEQTIINLMEHANSTFDYVLVELPSILGSIPLTIGIEKIDRGYIVIDEQIDCPPKINTLLNYLRTYSDKSSMVSNIIINKRTGWAYPFEMLDEIGCKHVVDVPLIRDMNDSKTKGVTYIQDGMRNKKLISAMNKLMADMF